MSWDNEVTISTNQAVGSFSTTIDIPNLEKVYYFRAWASNAGGTVVSNKVGVFVPSAPVGVADLQGRWSFDGGNAKDSSGKTRHGTAKRFLEPTDISNLALWLDAADTSTISESFNLVSQWNDKSGNNYHAVAQSGEEPTTGVDNINGKNVLYLGKLTKQQKINRSTPTNANWQDVYIVSQYTGGSTFTDVPSIMSGVTTSASDNGIGGGANSGYGLYLNIWTDNFYLNGTTNDASNVVGTMSSPFLVSFSQNTAISITGYQVGQDFTTGRGWKGVFGEVIAFNAKLSTADREKVEGYLAHKWGLTNNLPSSHPFKVAPLFPLLLHPNTSPTLLLVQAKRLNSQMGMWRFLPVRPRMFLMVEMPFLYLPG